MGWKCMVDIPMCSAITHLKCMPGTGGRVCVRKDQGGPTQCYQIWKERCLGLIAVSSLSF